MRKLITRGGLLVVVGLALMALVRGWSRSDRVTLPDGRVLEVWGTTYGTNHVAPGQFLQQLDKQLPKPVSTLLRRWRPKAAEPVQFVDEESQASLMVWLRFVGNSGTNRSRIFLSAHLADPVVTVAGVMLWPHSATNSTALLDGPRLSLLHFPRDQRFLTLHLLVANPVTHRFDPIPTPLRVRNPNPYHGPEFRAEALPTSRTNQGVRAELVELTVLHSRALPPGKPPRLDNGIRFSLKVETETHQPATILSSVIFDAGGNGRWDLGGEKDRRLSSSGLSTFDNLPDLGSAESVYRLRIEAEPSPSARNSETVEFVVDPGDPREPNSAVCEPRFFRSQLVPGLEIQKILADGYYTLGGVSCVLAGPAADARVRLMSIKDSKGQSIRFSANEHARNLSIRPPNQWKEWRANPSANPNLTPPYTFTFQILPIARFEFSAAPGHVTNSFRVPE